MNLLRMPCALSQNSFNRNNNNNNNSSSIAIFFLPLLPQLFLLLLLLRVTGCQLGLISTKSCALSLKKSLKLLLLSLPVLPAPLTLLPPPASLSLPFHVLFPLPLPTSLLLLLLVLWLRLLFQLPHCYSVFVNMLRKLILLERRSPIENISHFSNAGSHSFLFRISARFLGLIPSLACFPFSFSRSSALSLLFETRGPSAPFPKWNRNEVFLRIRVLPFPPDEQVACLYFPPFSVSSSSSLCCFFMLVTGDAAHHPIRTSGCK